MRVNEVCDWKVDVGFGGAWHIMSPKNAETPLG